MTEITSFDGNYSFLSNFYYHDIKLANGLIYPTNEHAFQSLKCMYSWQAEMVRLAKTPSKAKRLGRSYVKVSNWESIKVGLMYQINMTKFKDPVLKELLLNTGDMPIIEGNYWGDIFWGQSPIGIGENHLGKILMNIRKELRKD